ncbi:hypothetical protein ACFGVR_10665 [Mucilaginibacter sp. AW1-3]
MKSNAPAYVLKVWLTSVLTGSLFAEPIMDGFRYSVEDFTIGATVSLVLSFGFSVPSFIAFVLIVSKITKMQMSNIKRKIFLSVVACILTIIPFVVLRYMEGLFKPLLIIPYGVAIIAGIWLYKLRAANPLVGELVS